MFVIVDENTRKHCLPHIEKLLNKQKVHVETIGQGEGHKNIDTVMGIWNALQRNSADSNSFVIALGGGMLLDVAGFAAATFKRGIGVVNLPTTLLSMVDASLGGKTGFNLNHYKNHIGVYRAPSYVFIYPFLTRTLEKRHFYAGWAEMLKHGLIQSRRHFDQLLLNSPEGIPDDELARLIRDSVDIKNYYVTRDPWEGGIRKALNFGHTLGHAFESLSMRKQRPLLHGEAVAYGLLCEYMLSVKLLGADPGIYEALRAFINRHYPAFQVAVSDFSGLYQYLSQDKKNRQEKINFTLLKAIGEPLIDQYVSLEAIGDGLSIDLLDPEGQG